MFAASCVGIAFLVVALEFCRRMGKEYDALIIRQSKRNLNMRAAASFPLQPTGTCEACEVPFVTFRATLLQQLIRAVIHATVFGLAYLVMLLAMYYNGYIIISIILGAGLGKFLCDWLVVKLPSYPGQIDEKANRIVHGIDEASVCCG